MLVACDETRRPVSSLLCMPGIKTTVMTAEGCVGCVSWRWEKFPVKRMKIHALAHFVAHGCNCGAMFPSVDGLPKHRVRCRLFTDLYEQTDTLVYTYTCCLSLSPRWTPGVFRGQLLGCGCKVSGFHPPPPPPLLRITHRTPAFQCWLDRHWQQTLPVRSGSRKPSYASLSLKHTHTPFAFS